MQYALNATAHYDIQESLNRTLLVNSKWKI